MCMAIARNSRSHQMDPKQNEGFTFSRAHHFSVFQFVKFLRRNAFWPPKFAPTLAPDWHLSVAPGFSWENRCSMGLGDPGWLKKKSGGFVVDMGGQPSWKLNIAILSGSQVSLMIGKQSKHDANLVVSNWVCYVSAVARWCEQRPKKCRKMVLCWHVLDSTGWLNHHLALTPEKMPGLKRNLYSQLLTFHGRTGRTTVLVLQGVDCHTPEINMSHEYPKITSLFQPTMF